MARHGVERALDVCLGIARALRQRLFQRHPAGHIAIQRIVRRSLIGENVGHDAALSQLGNDVAAVADQPDGDVLLLAHRVLQDAQRFVERVHHEIAIAGAQALLDTLGIDLDAEVAGARHGRSQRLRAAHAAHAARDDQLAFEIAAQMLLACRGEGFERTLNDSLRANVDP